MLPKLEIDPTGAPPKGHGARRWLLIALMIAMVPIVALAILWGTVRSRATTRLRKAVAEAEAMDPGRWRLADVWANRPAIPVETNSAVLLASTMRDLPLNWFGDQGSTGEQGRRSELLSRLDERQSKLTDVLPPEDVEWLRSDLASLGGTLDQLRLLADRPYGRPATKPAAVYATTPISHINSARYANRLLLLDAVRRAAEHDTDGALDNVRAMANVGRSMGDELIARSQLERMVLDGNALRTLQRVLAQGEPSDASLRKLDELLAIEAREPILEWAMTGERAGNFDMLERLSDGRLGFNQFLGAISGARFTYWVAPPRVTYEYNSALMLDLMNEAVAISRRPLREQVPLWQAWEVRVASERRGYLQMIATAPTMLTIPAPRLLVNRALDHAAELAAARTLIAAERYRLAHGDWPASMDDLVPEFLPALIDDPFGAGPIRLRRDEDGLVIYSVGSDGEDNGGRELRTKLPVSAMTPPTDAGFRLYNPLQRRRPEGRVTVLPQNVFAPEGP